MGEVPANNFPLARVSSFEMPNKRFKQQAFQPPSDFPVGRQQLHHHTQNLTSLITQLFNRGSSGGSGGSGAPLIPGRATNKLPTTFV